jgi:hypothetical protein
MFHIAPRTKKKFEKHWFRGTYVASSFMAEDGAEEVTEDTEEEDRVRC